MLLGRAERHQEHRALVADVRRRAAAEIAHSRWPQARSCSMIRSAASAVSACTVRGGVRSTSAPVSGEDAVARHRDRRGGGDGLSPRAVRRAPHDPGPSRPGRSGQDAPRSEGLGPRARRPARPVAARPCSPRPTARPAPTRPAPRAGPGRADGPTVSDPGVADVELHEAQRLCRTEVGGQEGWHRSRSAVEAVVAAAHQISSGQCVGQQLSDLVACGRVLVVSCRCNPHGSGGSVRPALPAGVRRPRPGRPWPPPPRRPTPTASRRAHSSAAWSAAEQPWLRPSSTIWPVSGSTSGRRSTHLRATPISRSDHISSGGTRRRGPRRDRSTRSRPWCCRPCNRCRTRSTARS